MLFELVVLVVGVFHYRDFCLEGMQLAPELSDSCRNRLYRRHEFLQLRAASTGDCGGCRVSIRCDLGESETCVGGCCLEPGWE